MATETHQGVPVPARAGTDDQRIVVDWPAAAEEFRAREFGSLRKAATAIPGDVVATVSELFEPDVKDDVWRAAAPPALRRALRCAATVESGLTILAAYIYGMCLKRWEHSIDHDTIRRMAETAADTYAATFGPDAVEGDASGVSGHDVHLAGLLFELGVSLRSCMAAENGLNCSCPVDVSRHAAAAAKVGERVLAECHQYGSGDAGYGFVAVTAAAQATYFGAAVTIAQAVGTFIEDRGHSTSVLQDAIEATERAERSRELRGDVYESELRSHRITLERMRDLVSVPAVQVDEGRIFYMYPFAVLGMSSDEVAARLLSVARGRALAATSVVDVGELDVTDAWEHEESGERSYRAVGLTLPELTITTTAGVRLTPHQVELRATTIGTCYLRIAAQLRDVAVHGLNQAMRRGSVYMGVEDIREGDAHWGQLSDYAADVIAGVGELLAEGRESVRVVVSIPRRQHTILSIRRMSLVSSTGERHDADYEQVQDALGARLFDQRINYASATLEEYVRVPRPDPAMLIRDVGFEGEAIVRNTESTIIVMPTTPNFIALYYEDMAEFSASLPALVDQWTTAISEQRRDLKAQLPRFEALWSGERMSRSTFDALSKDIRHLEHRQASLQETVNDAQAMLAFVHSSELCQSVKYRQILDRLFEGADVPRLQRDFDAQVAQVDVLCTCNGDADP